TQAPAVDASDDRYREGAYRFVCDVGERVLHLRLRGIQVLHLRNIGAGNEGLVPRTGDDRDPHRLVSPQATEGFRDRPLSGDAQGIALVRIVDGNVDDPSRITAVYDTVLYKIGRGLWLHANFSFVTRYVTFSCQTMATIGRPLHEHPSRSLRPA